MSYITPGFAAAILVTYGLVYVIPLHVSPHTRPSPKLNRDSPNVIRARVKSVTLSTLLCSLVTLLLLLCSVYNGSLAASMHLMGYWPVGLAESAKALLLTSVLFVGPLYESLLIEGNWKPWCRLWPLLDIWNDLITWRNIVVGPLTEEVLFRSASVPLLILSGSSLKSILLLSPLVFGVAHIHHFYEFRITHPQVPLGFAILRTILQFSYTTLFGSYATFVYLRTGSLLGVILVHALCNSLGLPRFTGHVEPHWYSVLDQHRSPPWVWTLIYYSLLVIGLYSWWINLYPLTYSEFSLAEF